MDLHQHQQPTTTTAASAATNPNPKSNRAEAERLLGIADKLLQTRDLTGSREFALLAQETEPLLEGSDQILAIADVLLASERRVVNNRHHDWYAILQINRQSLSSDPDLLKKNYRRLALLLHPDKNRYSLADSAFKLVADAWAILSDLSKKGLYDHEVSVYEKVELRPQPRTGTLEKDKLPIRRSPRGVGGTGSGDGVGFDSPPPDAPHNKHPRGSSVGADKTASFWTACPYCYVLYEYPRAYEECCIRCQNCARAFHASVIESLPPIVPGKEAYYCCWGFFPLGFSLETNNKGKQKKQVASNQDNLHVNNTHKANSGFPNWMSAGLFTTPGQGGGPNVNASVGGVDISDGSASAGLGNNYNKNVSAGFPTVPPGKGAQSAKKRGRPRKNPLPV